MINLRGPGKANEYYNEYTGFDAPVYTHFLGNDSIPFAWERGAIGVVPSNGAPSSYTSTQTIDFALNATGVVPLVMNNQFHGLLNKALDEPKFKSDGLEDKECSVQFRGRRNCLVHAACVGETLAMGTALYWFPSPIPKSQNSPVTAYAFLAVDEKTLVELLRSNGVIAATADPSAEMLGRLYIGRADIGKEAGKKNVPVYSAPLSQ